MDRISLKEMILPLVVLDDTPYLAKDPNHAFSVDDLKAWERRHGRVPKGAFAALRTDMYKDWDADPKRFERSPFPAWAFETIKFLYEERGVTATGHESMDTDTTDKMDSETYILQHGHYQIEVMANLDKVPPTGALIVVSWPKVRDGLGFRRVLLRYCLSPDNRRANNKAGPVPTRAGQVASGRVALGLDPGVDLPSGFVLAEAVTRLQAFDQLVATAPDACEILVGELDPVAPHTCFELHPVTLNLVPIHPCLLDMTLRFPRADAGSQRGLAAAIRRLRGHSAENSGAFAQELAKCKRDRIPAA
jgi:kynurenine formamidase